MRRTPFTALALATIVGMILAGCTAADSPEDPGEDDPGTIGIGDPPGDLPDDVVLASALSPFDACEDLEAHVKEAALELVTPWGLDGGGWGPMPVEGRAVEESAEETDDAADTDAGSDGAGSAPTAQDAVGSSATGTNVQEPGVDEPDRVKTDGEHLYVLDGEDLRILDVTGADPVQIGRLPMQAAYDAQLLLAGDQLLITSSAPQAVPFAGEVASSQPSDGADSILPGPGGTGGTTTLAMVDVSDPSTPTVTERLTVDGATLSARLIDGVARVVARMPQGNLPWEHPEASGLRAERRALEANRELIRESDVEDWLPYAVHETADGGTDEGTLLACDRVNRPATFSGLGILSVLTIDVTDGDLGLDPDRNVGVLAGGDTVYASTERLYVATTRWVDWGALEDDATRSEVARDQHTDLHAFDLAPTRAEYVASGQVVGTLLDQWALSEYDGVLRVASTRGDAWDAREPSESYVTTFEVGNDGELEQLGQVDGLGLTERIYAVRFIGETGYVVTFRQTDPLYTIDLSDPENPTTTGELKILGYSAYLHPIGDGLLLGVGQDADDQGRTKGTKLSLFDVSDAADPQEIDTIVLADGSSDAEHDHRAFMHDPASGLTVVPYTRWSYDEVSQREDVDTGALGIEVQGRELREQGRIRHTPAWLEDLRDDLEGRAAESFDDDDWRRQERLWEWGHRGRITRSMVLDGRLLTISEVGVAVHDVDDLTETGWFGFDA